MNGNMKKILTYLFLFVVTGLYASPVNENRARQIASDFFSQTATRSSSTSLELEWAGSDIESLPPFNYGTEAPLMYIYNRGDSDGFVIVSGEDKVNPILAFSYEGRFDVDNMAGGARYLLAGWCSQIEAARDNPQMQSKSTENPYGNVVVNYTTPLWGQGVPYNNNTVGINGNMAITGCVATAMSIIAYYYKWPEKGVGTIPGYTISDGYQVPSVTLGHTYDYNNMLSDYLNGYTTEQANAISILMGDMGKSVKMNYGLDASGAYGEDVPVAMSTYFGYSKSALSVGADGFSYSEWVDILQENILTCGPTLMCGVSNAGGGHAFVLDGYTDADFFHINYGWDGYSNGYYLLPYQEYCYSQTAAFDMIPDKEGTSTYKDYLSLLPLYSSEGLVYRGLSSDAVSYEAGGTVNCKIGGLYNAGQVGFEGEWALVYTDDEGNWKNKLNGGEIKIDARLYYYNDIEVTLPSSTIEEGDRLRIYYKGKYSDSWNWARSCDMLSKSEIILHATPDQVAETLGVRYYKTDKHFMFISEDLAIQYSVRNSSNVVIESGSVASYVASTIDMSEYPKGEYTLSFASGGEPYTLVIVL